MSKSEMRLYKDIDTFEVDSFEGFLERESLEKKQKEVKREGRKSYKLNTKV